MSALETAWDEIHAANTMGWQVGRPYLHDEHGTWEQYAWLPSGNARGGKPRRDWIAVGPTEVECMREVHARDGALPAGGGGGALAGMTPTGSG